MAPHPDLLACRRPGAGPISGDDLAGMTVAIRQAGSGWSRSAITCRSRGRALPPIWRDHGGLAWFTGPHPNGCYESPTQSHRRLAAGNSVAVLSGRGVGEGAAVDVEVPEVGRAVGQGLPVGVHGGAVRRIARVHPDHGPVVTGGRGVLVVVDQLAVERPG